MKKAVAILLILASLLSFASCASINPPASGNETTASSTSPQTSSSDTTAPTQQPEVAREKYGKSCLTSHQKELYDHISQNYGADEIAFESEEPYADVYRAYFFYRLDEIDSSSVFGSALYGKPDYLITLSDAFCASHPEYVTYSYGSTLYAFKESGPSQPLPDDTPVISLKARYYDYDNSAFSKEDIERMKAAFQKVEEEWMAQLPGKDASEFERIDALTKLMCKEITYQECEFGNMPYGIVNGNLYCQGYAFTFSYFAKKLGIESIVVQGEYCGIAHAWNMVRIGDLWYQHDVTFIDTAVMNYDNYLASEERIRSTGHSKIALFGFDINYNEMYEDDRVDYPFPQATTDYTLPAPDPNETETFELSIFDQSGNQWVLRLQLMSSVVCQSTKFADNTPGPVILYRFEPELRNMSMLGSINIKTVPVRSDDSTETIIADMYGGSSVTCTNGTTDNGLEWSAVFQANESEIGLMWSAGIGIRISETEIVHFMLCPAMANDDGKDFITDVVNSMSVKKE